jgi:hypothetical protein
MNQSTQRSKNVRTGLILAAIAVSVFAYTIWAVMHDRF